MPNFIPERPLYRKERLLAGFLSLAVFLLLLLTRFLSKTALGGKVFWGVIVNGAALLLPALIFCTVRGRGSRSQRRSKEYILCYVTFTTIKKIHIKKPKTTKN